MKTAGLTFLKLGGSLITDKAQPLTPRLKIIRQIAVEISGALEANPHMQLFIGHGSGSFGHAVANEHGTQEGGRGLQYWQGFSEVWQAARQLNQLFLEIFHKEGLRVLAFPPSAGVIASNKELSSWDIRPIQFALAHHLIPVVQGDVIFDTYIGGTIFSTEKIFQYLSKDLQPKRILLAGADRGVYVDQNTKNEIIDRITPDSFDEIKSSLFGADAADVTGGMLAKVRMMVELVEKQPGLEVQIFSGKEPGSIKSALAGSVLGTLIKV